MKKLISIALSFIMLLTSVICVNFSALAQNGDVVTLSISGVQTNYSSFVDAWENAQGNKATLTLLQSTSVDDMLYGDDENNEITIDFAENTLTCELFELESGNYILNGTTGGIVATSTTFAGIVVGFEQSSNITFNGGIYSGAYSALSFANSTVVLNGGTFKLGSNSSIVGDNEISTVLPQGIVLCDENGTVVANHLTQDKLLNSTVVAQKCNHANSSYKFENKQHSKYCFDCSTQLSATENCSFSKIVTAPTCTDKGYTTYICACGNTYVGDDVVATGHNYGDFVYNDGTHTHSKYCKNCNDVQTYDCNYSYQVVEPTCVDEGYTIYTCEDCNYSYKDDYKSATGKHTLNSVKENEIPSTCLAEGSYDSVTYCTFCGQEIKRTTLTTAKSGHKSGGYTSNGDGTHSQACLVCGTILSISKSQCEYQEVVVAPTCTQKGYTRHICSVCGDEYKDTYVNTIAHTKVVDKAVSPTCTKSGKTEGSHCSVCNKVLVAQKTVSATGHNYSSSKVTKAPTSSKEGVLTYTCKNCGSKKTKSIAKLAKVSFSSVTAKSKGFKLTWKKKSTATGYQIEYSTSSKFSNSKKVTISKNSTVSKTVSKLKAKKKYYVRIRTYRTINGKKYYSTWSKAKTVTTKK